MVYYASERKEAKAMLRYQDEKSKANRIVDLTSLTLEQFEQLVKPFDAAFVRHMQLWTMEGLPRTGRCYSQYANCPLPTPEDRLLFILSYLKVAALQVAHAALFDMTQSNANKWIHVLLPVLHQTLQALGDLPARHLQELAKRLAELSSVGGPESVPFFITMAPSDQLHVPRTPLNKKRIIAARKSDIR
jgi:Helix-turn-helix of DDE superfamily endonuclease